MQTLTTVLYQFDNGKLKMLIQHFILLADPRKLSLDTYPQLG